MAIKTRDRCFAHGKTGLSPVAKMILDCKVLTESQGKQAVKSPQWLRASRKGVGLSQPGPLPRGVGLLKA